MQADGDKLSADEQNKYNKCVFCDQTLTAKDAPKLLECLHVTCNACITTKFSEIDRAQPILVHCQVSNLLYNL